VAPAVGDPGLYGVYGEPRGVKSPDKRATHSGLTYLYKQVAHRRIPMSSEILRMTTEIVVSHASLTELSTEQLVGEIKAVYNVLSSLEGGGILEEPLYEEAGGVKKPSIPLKDIVKAKYVVCLECGKKLKTLKTHLHKSHGLTAKEYYARFGLDPKKFPLVCKDYSATRSKMAKARGLGAFGRKKKAGV
jgi:predicted transcriptional regulator